MQLIISSFKENTNNNIELTDWQPATTPSKEYVGQMKSYIRGLRPLSCQLIWKLEDISRMKPLYFILGKAPQ